jgi:hypothetical protein
MKPLGDAFIKLVRMMIAPIVFCTVVAGVAGVGDMKSVGKAGWLALLYFEVVRTLALVIGLVVVNTIKPGVGMNVGPSTLDSAAVRELVGGATAQSTDRLPARHHPHERGRCLRERRSASGVALLASLRICLTRARRRGHPRVRIHRQPVACLVRDCRDDHEDGAAWGLRRDGLHHRQLRRGHTGRNSAP